MTRTTAAPTVQSDSSKPRCLISLTTVDWSRAQAGEIAGELLQARLARETAKPRVITLTPKLVLRAAASAIQPESPSPGRV